MAQYAKALPVDQNNNVYQVTTPNFASNQSWSSVFTVSSTIGLSDKTTVIQVTAVGAPALLKWGPGSITGTVFDAVVPTNTLAVFVVPQSVMGSPSSVMGANGTNGLYNKVSLLTIGTTQGSVFGSEY